jgi:hypothetical protein
MYEHDPLTERIIGCAIAVHRVLGPGLMEGTSVPALGASVCRLRGTPVSRASAARFQETRLRPGVPPVQSLKNTHRALQAGRFCRDLLNDAHRLPSWCAGRWRQTPIDEEES